MQAHENSIKVNIILQQQENGKIIASVLEAPDCNVAENSREKAISSIRESLMKKLNKAEVLCLELPIDHRSDNDTIGLAEKMAQDLVAKTTPAWLKSAGIFKADPQFEAFQQEIQSYRNELDALNL